MAIELPATVTNTPAAASDTPATPAASAAPAEGQGPPAGDQSLDSILNAAVAAAVAEAKEPAAGDVPQVDAKTDAKPESEAPAPADAPAKEPESETAAVARARAILATANKKEQAAREREANFTATVASRLKTNPKALLAEMGLSIDDVIDASIAEGKAPEAPKEPDRITVLEERIKARENAETELKLQTAIANTKAAITADGRFPTINGKGHQQLVVDFMFEYHATHGKPIPWDKAASLIEADLAPLPASAPKPPTSKPAPTPTNRPGTQTLTNKDTRDYVQPEGTLPEDPDKLLKFLVAGIQ